jgi:glycosyltransferase involved in cell wall biosynthesis
MKILFVHQNFPGQFKHLLPALVGQGHEVDVFTMNGFQGISGVRVHRYAAGKGTAKKIHPWLADFETKVIRGDAAYQMACSLADQGYTPDLIVAHPGWGESLFLKQVWPKAKLLIYCEFFYSGEGTDVGFDPEFPIARGNDCRIMLKNLNSSLHFDMADAGVSPTVWQRSTFPEPFRSKIQVIHDGIDCSLIKPNPHAWLQIGSLRLTRDDEVVTFVNRNLEPYRGYHVFMRALPEIMAKRPNAHILMVGGDGVSYGAKAPEGKTWKQIFLDEVKDQVDLSRIHYLGNIDYPHFQVLLQVSTVHVYLTYPFVLSWSLLEAMAMGCAIVASDTPPLHEAIVEGETGLLVDFFDKDGLAERVVSLLSDKLLQQRLGENARSHAMANFDLKTVCLPRMINLIDTLGRH